MKKSWIFGFTGILVAVFVGALLAIRIDKWLENKDTPLFAQRSELSESVPTNISGTAGAIDFREAVKSLSQSVVSVDNLQANPYSFEDAQVEKVGSGSGVIVSSKGYIVTNNHVVEGAQQVRVRLSDDRDFNAVVVGRDPFSDIAVLKVDAPGLIPAKLGDNSKLVAGEWVIALGNPLGYSNTVSVGVVSNTKRTLGSNGTSLLVDAIQTDAAINRGNSGGALSNANGEVIGINSAIITTSGGSIGIGFAIPINTVKKVTDEIIQYGRVRYGNLGLRIFNTPGLLMSEANRSYISEVTGQTPPRQNYGLIVRSIRTGSAADKAGIGRLDVLLEVDGKKLSDPVDYLTGLFQRRAGDQITLKYWSRGQIKTAKITLTEE